MKDYPYINYKQRGVLIVTSEKDKKKVINFLKETDDFERDYIPKGFIEIKDTVGVDNTISTVYMGKYDPNLTLLWDWASDVHIPLSFYTEDQAQENRSFYSTKEQTPLERELYNALKNLYYKVTNIRGVEIEELYAPRECERVLKVIKRFDEK